MTKSLRIGTRASPLALWQARHIADLLRNAAPHLSVEFVTIATTGDLDRDRPLSQIGGDGLFTKQIQLALTENRADVAVHSLKDLPTFVVEGLTLAAVPRRGPTGDVLVSVRHPSFAAMPKGAIVATSSLRRRAQLLHRRPDLRLVDMRGNVETRLSKLTNQDIDALVLAEAGLRRLGLAAQVTEVLDAQWMLPAVGQGALGLECRSDDVATAKLLAKLDHRPTWLAVTAERAMLRTLGGGCQVPIGAASEVDGETMILRGVVLAPDGSRRITGEIAGDWTQAEHLGQQLARKLLGQGAKDLL